MALVKYKLTADGLKLGALIIDGRRVAKEDFTDEIAERLVREKSQYVEPVEAVIPATAVVAPKADKEKV